MGYLEQEKHADASIAFHALFQSELEKAPKLHEKLAMVVQSSGSSEVYNWIGALPRLQPWVDARIIEKFRGYKFTIENLDFASGIEVDRNDLADDRLGMIGPRIRMMANAAIKHYESLVIDLLVDGFTNLAYDGKAFFATDHQDATETAQSNKGTATLDDSSALENAMIAMMKLTDEKGEPLDITPSHLICGPDVWPTARALLKVPTLDGGAANPNYGALDLIVSPRITGNEWFLLDLTKPVKPLLLQVRKAPEFVAQDKPSDENVFMRRNLRYGVDARHNAGYAWWQLAYGSDGSV